MKDRIRQIMEGSHMNQQTFAQFIGMSSASLSSIFTGRTKPTINIVEAIKNKIPSISTDWLMFGFGDMYITKDKTDETAQNDTHSSTESQLIDFGSTSQATPPSLFLLNNLKKLLWKKLTKRCVKLLRFVSFMMIRLGKLSCPRSKNSRVLFCHSTLLDYLCYI